MASTLKYFSVQNLSSGGARKLDLK